MKTKTQTAQPQLRSRTVELISPNGHVQTRYVVRCRSRSEAHDWGRESVEVYNSVRPGFSYRIAN